MSYRLCPCLRGTALVAALLASGAGRADEAGKLEALFDREWDARLRENPLLATSVGVHTWNDRLPSRSAADLARRRELWSSFLAELDAIDRSKLDVDDAIDYAVFREQLEDRLASYRFGEHEIPFNADSGFHTAFARLPFNVPLNTVRDYENYIARMREWPRYVGEQIASMKSGLDRGFTQPRAILDGIEGPMAAQIVADPGESTFWKPFERFPVGVPEEQRERLRQEGRRAIVDCVVPGYRTLRDFFVEKYVPGARESLGASSLPDGREYYAHLIRRFTTLELDADEVHRIGLAEVARIRGEMEAVIRQVGFEGSFAEFLEFLRTDPRFYARTPEELLRRAAWIAKRMDGKLPALFKTLPRLPYTVEAVPDDIAPRYTGGRYVPAPIGSTQPGRYWVNTYALETRPLYTLEALTLHEAVPGHHLQGALSQEQQGLPNFRRHSYISAFGEGWGLYSEWLGLEAGFYSDPYSDFGRLTYEMWRACRLVVDTGIHAEGWSRQRVVDYLASNTALSLHEIGTETDRYISWPGQALAYKIGELKIRELRRKAERARGAAFDVREFHDAVLRNGSVPLGLLEELIERWIRERSAGAAAAHDRLPQG